MDTSLRDVLAMSSRRFAEDLRDALLDLNRGDGRNLTVRQLLILLICHTDPHPQTVGALAQKLDIAPSGASHAIDRLEQLHLIRREPNPADARSTVLTRTVAGEEFCRRLAPTYDSSKMIR